MIYVLLLVILGLCGGGYYEYNSLQHAQQDALDAKQQQIAALDAQKKQLTDQVKQVTTDETAAQTQITSLNSSVKDLQLKLSATQEALTKASAAAQAAAPTAAAKVVAPSANPNDLGTIVTVDGRTFQKCQLLKVDAEGITVSHTEGITKITFGQLPPDLQKQFASIPAVTGN